MDMLEALSYKLQMFGVPIYGSNNVLCDNEAVYRNTITLESILNKNHHSIYYHRFIEAVGAKTIRVDKQANENNISYMFTKIMTASRRRFLLNKFTY